MFKVNNLTFYRQCQPQMASGDLIEWASNTALGAAIRWFTKKDVNHSSLLARFDYQGLHDRRFVFEAMGNGLDFNLLSRRLQQFCGRVYWYPLQSDIPKIERIRSKMLSKALLMKADHIKYDYWNLFKNALCKVSLNARVVFCSEFYHICGVYARLLPAGPAARPGEFNAFGVHEPRVLIWEGEQIA